MNLYMVYRIDRDDGQAPAIRAAVRPAHHAYMDAFPHRVRLGGPVLAAATNSRGLSARITPRLPFSRSGLTTQGYSICSAKASRSSPVE